MFRPSKMRFIVLTMSLAAALLAGTSSALAQETAAKSGEEKGRSASFWMERKLHLSQELLAGITAADFDKIAASAQAMKRLNQIEAFMRSRTPGYRTQLAIFEESLDEIASQADRDNVEGAALAFTQLTISCVNCHKQLRAAR